jgi:hypothetical protein
MKNKRCAGVVALALVGLIAGACTPEIPAAPRSSGVVQAMTLVRNPAQVTLAGNSTPAAWVPLPSATATVEVDTAPGSVLVDFWASVACVGTGWKYVQASLNGDPIASAALAVLPPTTASQSDYTASIRTSRPVPPGTYEVTIQVRVAEGSSCTISKDLWHLEVSAVAV